MLDHVVQRYFTWAKNVATIAAFIPDVSQERPHKHTWQERLLKHTWNHPRKNRHRPADVKKKERRAMI